MGRYGELLLFAIAALLLASQAHQMWAAFDGLAVDDAYISFRYAENLATGHGLVWNVGDRVEGYSNFLWVLLLAPLVPLTNDLTTGSQILGFVAALLTLWLALRALTRLGTESFWMKLLALSFIALSGYFSAWCVSGMETGLHGALILLAWLTFTSSAEGEPPPRRAALPLVALALLRPEGLFVALAALVAHLVLCRRARIPLRDGRLWQLPLLLVAPLLAYHMFRFGYYGPHLFPNSVRAKVGLSLPQIVRGVEHFTTNFLDPYFPLLLALMLMALPKLRSRLTFIGASLFAGYLLFLVMSGGDWSFGRLYAPLVPLGFVLLIHAVSQLGRLHARLDTTPARIFVVLALLGFGVWSWNVTGVDREYRFRTQFVGKDRERVTIGRWLATEAPRDTTVAVFAAGQIPYYSKLPAHDMLGLNDAHIVNVAPRPLGESSLPGHDRFDVDYTLGVIEPDVIIDPQYIPGMLRDERLRSGYRREGAFVRNVVLVKRGLSLHSPDSSPSDQATR